METKTWNQKETSEISWKRSEEAVSVEFDTHGLYRRQNGMANHLVQVDAEQ